MRDIIDMVREAGLAPICEGCDVPDVSYAYESWDEELKAFEALVRADERALAAPVQEPWSDERAYHEGRADYEASVGYFVKGRHPLFHELTEIQRAGWVAKAAKRLYTTPPAAQRQWVGLTDGEANLLWYQVKGLSKEFAKAIEAKLKEKNA